MNNNILITVLIIALSSCAAAIDKESTSRLSLNTNQKRLRKNYPSHVSQEAFSVMSNSSVGLSNISGAIPNSGYFGVIALAPALLTIAVEETSKIGDIKYKEIFTSKVPSNADNHLRTKIKEKLSKNEFFRTRISDSDDGDYTIYVDLNNAFLIKLKNGRHAATFNATVNINSGRIIKSQIRLTGTSYRETANRAQSCELLSDYYANPERISRDYELAIDDLAEEVKLHLAHIFKETQF
jgi:hypothetical protein